MLDERAQFGRVLGGPRRSPGLERRQGGTQMLGLQAAAGILAEFAREEPLGPVVAHIEVAGMAARALGGAEFSPPAGAVERAAELRRIDESFHQQHGMSVAGLPVGAQARQHQRESLGSQVRHAFLRQEQKPGIANHQRQTAPALLLAPADPLVTRAQTPGGGAEDQHPEPVAAGIGDHVMQPLAHGPQSAQIVVLIEELMAAGPLVRFE